MKKTIILSAALVSLSAVAFGTTASAATYNTNGVVTFALDEGTNSPLDPTKPDPTKPVAPIDPTKPGDKPDVGTTGPLSIDFASSFDFGVATIKATDATYSAAVQSFEGGTQGPNYVQVTDKRGSLDGWSLSVKQNGQLSNSKNEDLTGAVISFANASVASDMSVDTTPATVLTSLDLDTTEAIPVVTAGANEGMGTWVYRFGADAVEGAEAVTLFAPGSTVKRVGEQYKTTITWSLEATPTNP